jgi:hypothetical protein
VPKKDFFGRTTTEMEQKMEVYECAEGTLMVKTFQGIRNKIMTSQAKKE